MTGSELYDTAWKAAKVAGEIRIYPASDRGHRLISGRDVKLSPVRAAEWLHKVGIL